MTDKNDYMIEFRLEPPAVQPRGKEVPLKDGEQVLMGISAMVCLFPEHRQIRTIEHGWTVTVCEEDWPKVEKAFRSAYLGNIVRAV